MAPSPSDWRKLVERMIKSQMSRNGAKYQDLSQRLSTIGVNQSADNLRNKINKGILGADLMLQIMYVLDCKQISRDEIEDILTLLDRDN